MGLDNPLHIAFLLIVLSFFFAPFYIRTRVATLPDFLEMRYSRGCRNWWSEPAMARKGAAPSPRSTPC